jgi:hypothetical protein
MAVMQICLKGKQVKYEPEQEKEYIEDQEIPHQVPYFMGDLPEKLFHIIWKIGTNIVY